MATKLKNLIIIVSLGLLIYFVSLVGTLVAEDSENEAREKFADAMISVEASLVAVEYEVLEEMIGEPDIKNLNSIPLEKFIQCVREDEGEVISIVKLAVRNESSGEVNREERVDEKRKVSDENVSENEKRENYVSFQVVPKIIDISKIGISFEFKQIVSEGALVSESDAEEEQERNIVIEISSEVVLRPGQPRIVSATKKDEAIFLIIGVDM
ncbi:MAG: hypothetical protein ACYS17_07525 [Planctomycetota bacterium]